MIEERGKAMNKNKINILLANLVLRKLFYSCGSSQKHESDKRNRGGIEHATLENLIDGDG